MAEGSNQNRFAHRRRRQKPSIQGRLELTGLNGDKVEIELDNRWVAFMVEQEDTLRVVEHLQQHGINCEYIFWLVYRYCDPENQAMAKVERDTAKKRAKDIKAMIEQCMGLKRAILKVEGNMDTAWLAHLSSRRFIGLWPGLLRYISCLESYFQEAEKYGDGKRALRDESLLFELYMILRKSTGTSGASYLATLVTNGCAFFGDENTISREVIRERIKRFEKDFSPKAAFIEAGSPSFSDVEGEIQ